MLHIEKETYIIGADLGNGRVMFFDDGNSPLKFSYSTKEEATAYLPEAKTEVGQMTRRYSPPIELKVFELNIRPIE